MWLMRHGVLLWRIIKTFKVSWIDNRVFISFVSRHKTNGSWIDNKIPKIRPNFLLCCKNLFPKFCFNTIDFLYIFYCSINILIATEVMYFPLIFIATVFPISKYLRNFVLFIVAEMRFFFFRQPNLTRLMLKPPSRSYKRKNMHIGDERNQSNTNIVSSFSLFISDTHGKRMANHTIGKFMTIEYHNNLGGEP